MRSRLIRLAIDLRPPPRQFHRTNFLSLKCANCYPGKLLLSDFHYDLPEELIAQAPLADRAGARMLVVDRKRGTWRDLQFREFPHFIQAGDCLVFNDSKVIPSRLFGHRRGRTGKVEVFLVHPVSADLRDWEALVKPGRKAPVGERIEFDDGVAAEILTRGEYGQRTIRFIQDGDIYAAIERIGHIPLPPYIRRDDSMADRDRYQTMFARERGSVAAPTAGLHFTPEILEQCRAAGAETAGVTLHVGLGTFQPIREEVVEQNKLHAERFAIDPESARKIETARRVVAVGTTSVRTLETGRESGETDIFIYPGYEFQRAGAMLTNFHLPQSSLFILVCAFAGTELAKAAYRHAVEERYRFFSYGDCMLIV